MLRLCLIAVFVSGLACHRAAQPDDVVEAPSQSGELVLRTDNPELISTESLRKATGRDDFQVGDVECAVHSCRVRFIRDGKRADDAWTRGLLESLTRSKPEGIVGVEPSAPNPD